MYSNQRFISRFKRERGEKGAALVTVVLLLMLLMVACGAIILITSLSNTTTIDAVSEKQAYRAAEAGMQMAINVLRGNGSTPISFRDAATRVTSNKPDDWMPTPRLSNWLNYDYPANQPERVTLTNGYTPYNGLAFSVTIEAPDANPTVVPTPNPNWIDGPVVKPDPPVKPPQPAWHPWNCAHCSWDYTHCSLYNPPNNGTFRADGMGCRHKHCIPPPNWGGVDDGYERLLVKVVGYGPRGARKEIELLIKRVIFDYDAEPLIYIQGSGGGTPVSFNVVGNPEVKFDSTDNIAFILTNSADQTAIQSVIELPDKMTTAGKGDDYEIINPGERPKWLANADETRWLVADLEEDARVRGRFFNNYPTGNAGTDANPQFTFVRGDADLDSNGAGLLVVTGKLTINKNFTYEGMILLLGDGRLDITGGDAKIEGTVALARFGMSGDFLPVNMNFSGTGKTEFKYKSDKVDEAMKLINVRIMAVREQ